jgi:predicted GNAT family N-acyltransferase
LRIAETISDLHRVYRLCYEVYFAEGYCAYDPAGILCHYPKLDTLPETSILMIEDDMGNLIASNTLTLDSPAGFHVDEDFHDEVQAIREQCKIEQRKLAASWRIITASTIRNTRKVVFELIRQTINLGIVKGIDYCLFSFNPKHEEFYKKYLNLETVGNTKICHAANNAPAILMLGKRDEIIKSKIMEERE